ncbi:hypothetical protein [Sinanaerobacter chloroacetimidivorans]|jgi:hypothetical protein|uniref:Uncharacterized protein n=1 Tax=Sinanaerobacter chloroacetimidivorans TaxID=2818044 RepID=A0A8J8B3T8_9FIRM|nr:hypothetical protein [Sinanaerobacter chloroacetimidivorans]MBR0600116.1 hypothetical protein [Sinanaerobacter chloroacetimidivorans]
MLFKNREKLMEELKGRNVDFYLEDDMFEVEGMARYEDGRIIIQVLDAVGHMMELAGDFLELMMQNRKLLARRTDTGKVFEMEINRIYDLVEMPSPKEFLNKKALGADQFFHKPTDTLIWFDDEMKQWTIEKNKINMYFCGERTAYESLEQLFQSNEEYMNGKWQAVFFNSEVEEVYGQNYC